MCYQGSFKRAQLQTARIPGDISVEELEKEMVKDLLFSQFSPRFARARE